MSGKYKNTWEGRRAEQMQAGEVERVKRIMAWRQEVAKRALTYGQNKERAWRYDVIQSAREFRACQNAFYGRAKGGVAL